VYIIYVYDKALTVNTYIMLTFLKILKINKKNLHTIYIGLHISHQIRGYFSDIRQLHMPTKVESRK